MYPEDTTEDEETAEEVETERLLVCDEVVLGVKLREQPVLSSNTAKQPHKAAAKRFCDTALPPPLKYSAASLRTRCTIRCFYYTVSAR